jgi:hypothetical protein
MESIQFDLVSIKHYIIWYLKQQRRTVNNFGGAVFRERKILNMNKWKFTLLTRYGAVCEVSRSSVSNKREMTASQKLWASGL